MIGHLPTQAKTLDKQTFNNPKCSELGLMEKKLRHLLRLYFDVREVKYVD